MRRYLVLAVLLAGPFSAIGAQEITPIKPAPKRDGFYIGFGFGTGNVSYGGDLSDIDGSNALSGHFRLGGTLNPQWRLGAETNGWVKSEDGVDFQFGTLLGTATFYPSPTGNFFLKGGLGFAGYIEEYAGDEATLGGGAFSLGAGYDFRFSGNVGVSLVANYVTTGNAPVELNGSDTGLDGSVRLFQVGVGVIWH